MEEDNELLFGYLLSVYSKEYADKIMKGIKNPAKYPWITKELTLIYQTFQNKKEALMDKKFLRISEILEDELAYALFICQDSKCKPLNFINYKK